VFRNQGKICRFLASGGNKNAYNRGIISGVVIHDLLFLFSSMIWTVAKAMTASVKSDNDSSQAEAINPKIIPGVDSNRARSARFFRIMVRSFLEVVANF
jgi:hypothetical protein